MTFCRDYLKSQVYISFAMNITFENKRILVTGACQGIGKGIALRLSKHKGTVIALSNSKEGLAKLTQEDSSIQVLRVDLLDWEATKVAVKSILPIDLLVNNAGVVFLEPFLSASPKYFDLTFGVNVKAMLNISQVVAEDMLKRKVPGSIVNLSSQASCAALQDHTIYCMSKAAVNMLTKTMALELGPNNIRVNCVLPTVVMTELGKKVWSEPKKYNEMMSKIPLKRFAEIDDVVDSVAFLLSEKSSMITGTELPVDGGFLAT